MDINHSAGESVITSTKGYMWFLSLNIIFCAWLLLRGLDISGAESFPLILQILCSCIIALSLINLMITLKFRKNINDGFYHKALPYVVVVAITLPRPGLSARVSRNGRKA